MPLDAYACASEFSTAELCLISSPLPAFDGGDFDLSLKAQIKVIFCLIFVTHPEILKPKTE